MHRAGAGEVTKPAFDSSQLFTDALNTRPVYMSKLTPSDLHKQVRGETGREPRAPIQLSSTEAQTKVLV